LIRDHFGNFFDIAGTQQLMAVFLLLRAKNLHALQSGDAFGLNGTYKEHHYLKI
jgi:hypothetical protein